VSTSIVVTVTVTGNTSTGEVGVTAIVEGTGVTAFVSGVSSSGDLGDATVSGAANLTLTGAAANTFVGQAAIVAAATAFPSGVVATAAAGDVTVTEGEGVRIDPTGLTATGALGTPIVVFSVTVNVVGIRADGSVGSINIWEPVDDSQTPFWVDIPT
jgi:hypothetical protein